MLYSQNLKFDYRHLLTVFSIMKITLNVLERKLLKAIQFGLPLTRTPYQDLSKSTDVAVDEILQMLRWWKKEKKIRRLGAIVNHFQMGHGSGAMVVWQVPENRIDTVGQLFASFPAVSHAYVRPSNDQWPYNVYTMVHACDDQQLEAAIEEMRQKSGCSEFRKLKTVRELKKVPPTYIIEQ